VSPAANVVRPIGSALVGEAGPASLRDLVVNLSIVSAPICGPCREPMGSIASVLIKRSSIFYVVATFEHLELGADHYPVPWWVFIYNPKIGAYQTHLVRRQLLVAPKYPAKANWHQRADEIERSLIDYYGRCC
jgi:hypothetical protein